MSPREAESESVSRNARKPLKIGTEQDYKYTNSLPKFKTWCHLSFGWTSGGHFEVGDFLRRDFHEKSKFSLDFQWKFQKIEIFEKIENRKIQDFRWNFSKNRKFFDFSIFPKISIFWNFHWKSNENFDFSWKFRRKKSPTSKWPPAKTKMTSCLKFWERVSILIILFCTNF